MKNKKKRASEVFLKVKILSSKEKVFEGNVWAIASSNEVGPFSMVPGHAGFISLIREKVELYHDKKDRKGTVIPFSRAVLHCRDNNVKILIGSVV